jgi:hypothetical protein
MEETTTPVRTQLGYRLLSLSGGEVLLAFVP